MESEYTETTPETPEEEAPAEAPTVPEEPGPGETIEPQPEEEGETPA